MVELMIRPAAPGDAELLQRFVGELVVAEEYEVEVTAEPADLDRALFGDAPVAEAVVAEADGEPVGFALFYPSYSTISGRSGIHLEDLYISAEYRGEGYGLELLRHLAGRAAALGGRLEWWVLRTNHDAIRFYRRLGASGLDEIEVMRLDGERLTELVTS